MNLPSIIFEDQDIFVIDKPSGWISDKSNTSTNQPVIQKWISENYEYEANTFEFRNGVVHRLDKETSGLLVIAKSKRAYIELQRQFKERIVKKTYYALVHGKLNKNEGVIDEPVGRLPWRRDRFGVIANGRDAVTEYNSIAHYKLQNDDYSLVELKPKTGRTHQIRIHLKHLGFPIVSDEFYAGRKTSRSDRKWCARLFLHAGSISFLSPSSNKMVEFNSDLPSDLRNALENLVKIT